ncbi:MAG TPA: ABC transporter permease [Blastocatellia bacterium]|nr:ABC transporter permease [Blastocatellia bacterium]
MLAQTIARLILKRIIQAVPTLLIISALSFALIGTAPGDALSALEQDARIKPETIEKLRREYGLDRPLVARYGSWMKGVLGGDLGASLTEKLPVTTLIGARLANTLKLSLAATLLAWIVALPFGALAAVKRGSWVDRITGAMALASVSTPRLVLAIVALLFAARTRLFPIGNVRSLDVANDFSAASIADSLHHLVLPAVVMSLPLAAVYLRQMRAGMIEALAADFIRTARAKGLSERVVVIRHAARNALNPLITLFGYAVAALLSGSIIVETVMAWPGLGQLAVNSVRGRDVPVLMGIVMLTAVMMVIGNLLADILLIVSDPRLRGSETK